jgi:hypothetical protein
VGETLFNGGNSYGPETAQVQFAVAPQAGAVGTFFRGGKRVQRVRFRNIEGTKCNLQLQESPDLGDSNWVNVGSAVDVVPGGGEAEIDVTGLVTEPYVRIYGGPSQGEEGSAIVRATVTDADLLDHFRQNTPYGAG